MFQFWLFVDWQAGSHLCLLKRGYSLSRFGCGYYAVLIDVALYKDTEISVDYLRKKKYYAYSYCNVNYDEG